jgi:hypothetical protein
LLAQRFRRVVLLMDGDQAGQAASVAIATRLAQRCWVQEGDLAPGDQPDRLSSRQIQEVLHPLIGIRDQDPELVINREQGGQ